MALMVVFPIVLQQQVQDVSYRQLISIWQLLFILHNSTAILYCTYGQDEHVLVFVLKKKMHTVLAACLVLYEVVKVGN